MLYTLTWRVNKNAFSDGLPSRANVARAGIAMDDLMQVARKRYRAICELLKATVRAQPVEAPMGYLE